MEDEAAASTLFSDNGRVENALIIDLVVVKRQNLSRKNNQNR